MNDPDALWFFFVRRLKTQNTASTDNYKARVLDCQLNYQQAIPAWFVKGVPCFSSKAEICPIPSTASQLHA